jgi:hypothetical protein
VLVPAWNWVAAATWGGFSDRRVGAWSAAALPPSKSDNTVTLPAPHAFKYRISNPHRPREPAR